MSDINGVETTLPTPVAPDNLCQAVLARINDLRTPEWQRAFDQCETFSDRLLESRHLWMSPDYVWRIDPLHCWSRLWEYPFALSALESIATACPFRIIDVGSGANFFAPLLALQGHRISAVDVDRSVVRAGQRLAEFARTNLAISASSLKFVSGDAGHLPFPDEAADVVQSISVLEHIPRPHSIVPELARVLKPGGTIILTLDLSLYGTDGLDVAALQDLLNALNEYFELPAKSATEVFDTALDDADVLTNFTSPKNLRRRERIGPHHPTREVEQWPPIGNSPLRRSSMPRTLARARSRSQAVLAVFAIQAVKRD